MKNLHEEYGQITLFFLIGQIFGISYVLYFNNALNFLTGLSATSLIFLAQLRKENLLIYFIKVLTAGFAFGLITTEFKLYKNKSKNLDLEGEYIFSGEIIEIKPRIGELLLTLEIDFLSDIDSYKINKIILNLDVEKFKDTSDLMIGDRLIGIARLKKNDFKWFLNREKSNLSYTINGISATGVIKKVIMDNPDNSNIGFFKRIKFYTYKIRKSIYDSLLNKMGENGHFIAALVLGETGRLSRDVLSAARNTGVAHILCVSGLHLSIVCFIFFKLTRIVLNCWNYIAYRIDIKKTAAVVAIIASVSFLVLSGMQVAATRACIMTSVAIIGILLDRENSSIRVIFLTGIIMLAINPEDLYNPSFQLSYMAVMAIILNQKVLDAAKSFLKLFKLSKSSPYSEAQNDMSPTRSSSATKFVRYCLANLYITTLVTIVTLPIITYHFYLFANYSKLTNLIIVPLTSFVMMPLSIISLLSMTFGAEHYFLKILNYNVDFVLYIMRYIESLPNSIFNIGFIPFYLVAISCTSFLIFAICESYIKYISLTGMIFSIYLIFNQERPIAIIRDDILLTNHEDNLKIYSLKLKENFAIRVSNWFGNGRYEYAGTIENYLKDICTKSIDPDDKNHKLNNIVCDYYNKDMEIFDEIVVFKSKVEKYHRLKQ